MSLAPMPAMRADPPIARMNQPASMRAHAAAATVSSAAHGAAPACPAPDSVMPTSAGSGSGSESTAASGPNTATPPSTPTSSTALEPSDDTAAVGAAGLSGPPALRRGAGWVRGLGYYALWVVLIGTEPADLSFGVPVAAAAAWLSLRLLPPRAPGPRWGALLAMAPRFLWQSVVAGVDVAYRVFAPGLPIRPGWVRYRTALAPGVPRAAFTGITGLLPGTVPCGEDDSGEIVYHVLDVGQDVPAQLAAEEARLAGPLGAALERAR
jgi:multicomponent Na+:H+ antiporter subunit E